MKEQLSECYTLRYKILKWWPVSQILFDGPRKKLEPREQCSEPSFLNKDCDLEVWITWCSFSSELDEKQVPLQTACLGLIGTREPLSHAEGCRAEEAARGRSVGWDLKSRMQIEGDPSATYSPFLRIVCRITVELQSYSGKTVKTEWNLMLI